MDWLKRVVDEPKAAAASRQMTPTEFAAGRMELPESGRWYELHDGVPVPMEPPDDVHGNIVRNLTLAFARWLQEQGATAPGYACHEVGLIVRKEPGTVFCPAISYFEGGQMFDALDEQVTTSVPKMVIDIASANDRRRNMHIRVSRYLQMGVQMVWVPDPVAGETSVVRPDSETEYVRRSEILDGRDVMPGLRLEQDSIFVDPSWWTA